jgi:serine/threonine protein phosphatase PrpC
MFEFSSYLEQQNERGDDALYIVELDASLWFCISDGAGGTGEGEKASCYVVEAFKELTQIKGFDSSDDFEKFLRTIDAELSRESHGGECTSIVGKVLNGTVVGASVGDSEAWLFNLEYDYELTSMQNIKPLLGSGSSIPIGFGPMNVEQFMLIGSDGLFKYVKHKEIKYLLSSNTTAVEIAELAKKETGNLQDDISAIFINKKL